ncbi:MAG: hypothetical protein IPF99_33410, partial [Deltaproteobacteria bacterium]|nr:hypothetical protein [Deltaproteobacteria bacterium]
MERDVPEVGVDVPTEPMDTGPDVPDVDVPVLDDGPIDTGPIDTGSRDVGPVDADVAEAGMVDDRPDVVVPPRTTGRQSARRSDGVWERVPRSGERLVQLRDVRSRVRPHERDVGVPGEHVPRGDVLL